jgi:hypothetical protein
MNPDDPTPPEPSALRKDALIAAEIERTMQPFLHLLTAEKLAIMRAILEETLRSHPVAEGILGQLGAVSPVNKSGDRPLGEAGDEPMRRAGGGKESA